MTKTTTRESGWDEATWTLSCEPDLASTVKQRLMAIEEVHDVQIRPIVRVITTVDGSVRTQVINDVEADLIEIFPGVTLDFICTVKP